MSKAKRKSDDVVGVKSVLAGRRPTKRASPRPSPVLEFLELLRGLQQSIGPRGMLAEATKIKDPALAKVFRIIGENAPSTKRWNEVLAPFTQPSRPSTAAIDNVLAAISERLAAGESLNDFMDEQLNQFDWDVVDVDVLKASWGLILSGTPASDVEQLSELASGDREVIAEMLAERAADARLTDAEREAQQRESREWLEKIRRENGRAQDEAASDLERWDDAGALLRQVAPEKYRLVLALVQALASGDDASDQVVTQMSASTRA